VGPPFECRKRTEADQHHEDYEAALLVWKRTVPTCSAIGVFVSHSSPRARIDANNWLDSDDDIDAIESDLASVREWLRKRPEEPKL
jgi:hypothetical protein